MEAMRAIRDGVLPPPPLARLIGFRHGGCRAAAGSSWNWSRDESLENTIGLLHGATAAALLDTAMGCAISTMLPAGQALGHARPETDLSAAAVGALGHDPAEGKVIKLGRQTSYTEGFVRDGAGNLAVHATATFSMIGGA